MSSRIECFVLSSFRLSQCGIFRRLKVMKCIHLFENVDLHDLSAIDWVLSVENLKIVSKTEYFELNAFRLKYCGDLQAFEYIEISTSSRERSFLWFECNPLSTLSCEPFGCHNDCYGVSTISSWTLNFTIWVQSIECFVLSSFTLSQRLWWNRHISSRTFNMTIWVKLIMYFVWVVLDCVNVVYSDVWRWWNEHIPSRIELWWFQAFEYIEISISSRERLFLWF